MGGLDGGQGMANCHVCRKEIPRADLEAQLALILLRKRYCRECATAIAEGRFPSRPAGPIARFGRFILGRKNSK